MRALVTGAGGFLGGALVAHLRADGHEVAEVVRAPTPGRPLAIVARDLAIPGALDELVDDQTTIFHCAASADVRRSVEQPRHDLHNTFLPLFEILETARRTGAKVILPSTASIFDSSATLPLPERAFARPSSPYGAAKQAAEAYCFAYHRSYGVDVRVARLFSVYGPGMRRMAIHDLIMRVAEAEQTLTILGDGTQVRDYLFISDAVDALCRIATHGTPGEDYNVGSGEPVMIRDLAARIAVLMHKPHLVIVPTGATFAGDTPRWYADTARVTALGAIPRVSLDEGLRRTIAFYHPHAGASSAEAGTP